MKKYIMLVRTEIEKRHWTEKLFCTALTRADAVAIFGGTPMTEYQTILDVYTLDNS